MLLRDLSPSACADETRPAFDVVSGIQSNATLPYGVLLQSEHSRLAGALAKALQPDVFGPLHSAVISAIAHHDYGWDISDLEQIEDLPKRLPTPFTRMSAEATLPSWIGSIARASKLGPLPEILVSRHCCLLGTGSGKHAGFVEQENARRTELEQAIPYAAADLDRWTAALGFCDLLSLYLCCGSTVAVTLPLAHPDTPGNARTITLQWIGEQPQLSEPVLTNNQDFHAHALSYNGPGSKPAPLNLNWAIQCS